MTAAIVISLHDVAPGSFAQSATWLNIVERHGMRASLLVIAGPWRGRALAGDLAFAEWLRAAEARGHEVVLHGWEHQAIDNPAMASSSIRRLYGAARARGCGEFQLLDQTDASRRIERGRDVLAAHGFHPIGFTPPGWLASPGTYAALRELGYRYTTTQWGVHDLVTSRVIRMFATSQRPGSVYTVAAAWLNERLAAQRFAAGRGLRVALHPDDLAERGLREATERTLQSARVHSIPSLTYGELVGIHTCEGASAA